MKAILPEPIARFVDSSQRKDVMRHYISQANIPALFYQHPRRGRTGKPVILSSGMSSWDELDEAVATVTKHQSNLTVLQCTSEYPCPPERVGLNAMQEMRERYGLPVGLSDHTLSNAAALAAVTLGASIVEKHFTLSKRMYGSDARNSAEPQQFADLVSHIREIEAIMSHKVDKSSAARFTEMKEIFEKSIVSLVDIPEGAVITEQMLGIKKPGSGIPPKRLNEIIGSRALRHIPTDTLIAEEDVAIPQIGVSLPEKHL